MKSFMCAMALAVCVAAASAQTPAPRVPADYGAVLQKLRPSVMKVRALAPKPKRDMPPEFEKYFSRYPAPDAEEGQQIGSGFVFDAAQGLVVTSEYVVADATKIEVTLADGTKRDAKIVGSDSVSGVALIRIAPQALVNLTWATHRPRLGEPVLLYANAYDTGLFASAGTVGAETFAAPGRTEEMFLADVVVHSGSAGGLLADANGAVLGMAMARYGASPNANFDIGVGVVGAEVKRIAALLARDGKVVRGQLGLLPKEAAFPTFGVVVGEVTAGSSAERGGLKVGDVIVRAAGQPVADADALRRLVAAQPIGSVIPIMVTRGKEQVTLNIVVEAKP